jgi:hypothetical protein
MSDTQKKVTREGSGRTKGSVSFVEIELGQLCSRISDPTTRIKVSRLQMEAMGFQIKPTAPPVQLQTLEIVKPKTTVIIHDFDAQVEKASEPVSLKDF